MLDGALKVRRAVEGRNRSDLESDPLLAAALERFIQVVDDVAEKGEQATPHSRMLIRLIPEQFIGPQRVPVEDAYLRLLLLTDFVSGMTDSYAVSLYKKVTGISLPGG
jgi:dGTPase